MLDERKRQGKGHDTAPKEAQEREASRTEKLYDPKERWLVPRNMWPTYPCDEHAGQGWEVTLGKKRRGKKFEWVRCTFVNARTPDGLAFRPEWIEKKRLIPLNQEAKGYDATGAGQAQANAWTMAVSGGVKFTSNTDGEVLVPHNQSAAERSPQAKEWRDAMEAELASHRKAGTWQLVPATSLPRGRKLVGSRWVYALKRASDGTIKRYKARLVAQGYSQIEGYDYYATFANTVSFDSIRLALAPRL